MFKKLVIVNVKSKMERPLTWLTDDIEQNSIYFKLATKIIAMSIRVIGTLRILLL